MIKILTSMIFFLVNFISLTTLLVGQVSQNVFFSEYAEGTSQNKYLEIYNGTDSEVDLSAYSLSKCTNGCDTEGQFDYPDIVTFAPSTIVAAGDFVDTKKMILLKW